MQSKETNNIHKRRESNYTVEPIQTDFAYIQGNNSHYAAAEKNFNKTFEEGCKDGAEHKTPS
jgi:hypothetical protein